MTRIRVGTARVRCSPTRSPHRTTAAALALLLVLAGCGSDDPNSVAEQAKAGDGKGYIAGSGAVETVAPDRRGAPVDLTGTTLDGQPWDAKAQRGKIVVLNVWGSWCPPCVSEMPDLEKAHQQLKPRNVVFLGLNYRESRETGAAFAKARGLSYPSLADDGGRALLALQGKARTTPTTLVLDRQGRIAARVAGPVTASTLTGLVDDVAKER